VYVPAPGLDGAVIVMGLASNVVKLTLLKPAIKPPELQAMLYWLGLLVVALYVRLALVTPLHIDGLLPNVIVGFAFTITPMLEPVLLQPVVVFLTVNVPLYVPAPGLDGAVIVMGLAGNEVKDALPKPAIIPPALQVMLYWLGLLVVAL
jgi:hypothetical protein